MAPIVLGCVPTVGDTVEILTMDGEVSACASAGARAVTTIQKIKIDSEPEKKTCVAVKSSTVPYVLDVLGNEIQATVQGTTLSFFWPAS